MEKQRDSLSFSIFLFLIHLIYCSLPIGVGFVIYNKYGAEWIAGMAFYAYLLFIGVRMSKVVKAIINNEPLRD